MAKINSVKRNVKCQSRDDGFTLSFFSMASLCEILVDTQDEALAKKMGIIAANEAWRIEDKYSRYNKSCLLYTSPSPRDKRQSRMPSSA